MKITGRKSAYDVGDVVVAYLSGREIKSTVVNVLTNDILGYDYVTENDELGKVSVSHYDILGLADLTEPKKLVTKDRYEVGDVILIPMVVGSLDIRGDNKIKGYFGKSGGYCHHSEVLGLFSDNEPKDNEGWIMVVDELPDAKKSLFFVFETGIVLLGYFSEVSGNFIAYTVPNLYLAYQPKQVIKWQYVKFPKI